MYFLTTVRVCGHIIDDVRTIACDASYGDLHRKALSNECDMYEQGYYQYAVVTFVEEKVLYPNVVEQQWFYFNKEEQSVITDVRPVEIGDAEIYIIG